MNTTKKRFLEKSKGKTAENSENGFLNTGDDRILRCVQPIEKQRGHMPSLVHDLQNDLRRSDKSVTEMLRTAKLISAKLGLSEISAWLDSELNGYKNGQKAPDYRTISGGSLYVLTPHRGWQFAGHLGPKWRHRNPQGIAELEELAKGEIVSYTPNPHVPLKLTGGWDDGNSHLYPQEVQHSSVEIKRILEAVKNRLLDWAIELEQRGILGDNMSFDAQEKQSAQRQTFHIQNATGIFGNVSNSNVAIYDYGSIHQAVKDAGVSRDARNEIEDILDELKEATPENRESLIERGKAWVVKNQDLLGATASIVLKALGSA